MKKKIIPSILLGALMFALPFTACSENYEAAPPSSSQTDATNMNNSEDTTNGAHAPEKPSRYTYEVVGAYPHDCDAFTQGLEFHNGQFIESTGLYGSSTLRRVEPQTGFVLQKIEIDKKYFAEGITIFKDKIFQLTWQAHVGFIYDLAGFQKIGEFRYAGEGWGLTHDDKSLILSDGTNQLRFLDPATFKVVKTISVHDGDNPLTQLNELEYIKGEIYANIWQTDRIARIDPHDGKIRGWIDLTGLLAHAPPCQQPPDVLNGIAYDEHTGRLFVTGKLWPQIFEIRLKKK